MIVYALVGSSGTGKSFQAMNLCKEKGIESIIDDGLFIHKGKVLAGQSAKKEATKVGAVKTALFLKDEHQRAVIRKIQQHNISNILIIGTSIVMVEKIVARLELPKISRFVFIEDITTEGERNIAQKQRTIHGKHVVPAPSKELKRQFSGYFLNPLKMFKGFDTGVDGSYMEKTEVRPTFSYEGKLIISDKAVNDIVRCIAIEVDGVLSILKVTSESTYKGVIITILLSMQLTENNIEKLKYIQKKSLEMISFMTSYNVIGVDIELRDISL